MTDVFVSVADSCVVLAADGLPPDGVGGADSGAHVRGLVGTTGALPSSNEAPLSFAPQPNNKSKKANGSQAPSFRF